MPMSLILAIIKLAPMILGLIQTAVQKAHDSQMLDAGQAKAIADALTKAQAQTLKALVDAEEAERRFDKDPKDVDPDVFREKE
jgi:uncharacterized membrane protein affecting hemolysin expression